MSVTRLPQTQAIQQRSGARADALWLASLCLLVALVWFAGLHPLMPWGDDWAGYLMQARALVEGRVDAEIAINTLAMDGSDVQIGPYGYPWGYPILLAAAGAWTGWNMLALKVPGGLSMLLLAVSMWSLTRVHVGRGLAAIGTLAVCLQPAVMLDAGFLGSDVPFLAVSALALALTFRQAARVSGGAALDAKLMVAVAVASAVAFSIRSNGAVLPCTYLAAVGLMALRRERPWSDVIAHGLAFAAITGALIGLYFAALPDGSLVHASYLSADPAIWAGRMLGHLHSIAAWTTANAILGPAKLVPLALLLSVMAWGIARRPWPASVALVYLALHLVLLTAFPYDGGQRYYHPLLPAAALLLVLGLQGLGERLGALGPNALRAVAWGIPAVLCALMLGKIRIDQLREAEPGIDAPYATATRDVIQYVRSEAPQDARIAFFRPRAFRLLSGSLAVAINQPANLGRIDWYVFNGGTDDPRTQISETALRDSSEFFLRHERPPYRIYVRQPAASLSQAQ